MADLVAQLVQVESPVHLDEVVARVRDAFGLQRAGARIQAAVEQGVERAVAHRGIVRDGDFLSLAGATVTVRDRRNASSGGLRKIEMLPPSELEVGVLAIVVENPGATGDEVVRMLSRMVGLRASNPQLRAAIAAVPAALSERGRLQRQDRMLLGPAVEIVGKGAAKRTVIEQEPFDGNHSLATRGDVEAVEGWIPRYRHIGVVYGASSPARRTSWVPTGLFACAPCTM